MNREELAALGDAIDTVLSWPPAVFDEMARWLAPEAAKPNGRDPHPPVQIPKVWGFAHDPHPLPIAATSAEVQKLNISSSPRRSPAPYAGKARRGKSMSARPDKTGLVSSGQPENTSTEQRLLAAMRESPGLSVAALAKAAGGNRSSVGERLRQLARRGTVTKDSAGHWRLVADLVGDEPGPMEASPS